MSLSRESGSIVMNDKRWLESKFIVDHCQASQL